MRIAVTGSTGLIGSALFPFLEQQEHQVIPVIRNAGESRRGGTIRWLPDKGVIAAEEWEGFDAIIHLAGENIANRRWTRRQKNKIFLSRTQGTRLLSQTLAELRYPPRVLLSASATGYYGARKSTETVSESSTQGKGFLAEVTHAWEESTKAAEDAGIRVVHMRFGIILSRYGGALAKMLPLFKWGLGGKIGTGKQMMSWVTLQETARIISFLLEAEDVSGPVNIVAPAPVSNQEYTRILARTLHRPAVFPLPAPVARLALGEMAQELLLSGSRIVPEKLTHAGYEFQYTNLESALKDELKAKASLFI
ncbi:TIGR01777 family protein [Kroppenstedtia pulmonis]|uniref:TIGR01777 family protein n=1 Tax=Kroppenstedtia pulmonis TaxID=1380685 RepID=A0A7D4BIK3_9BACL|nr:TIGR01777 family oxidoreductase [Kroppenstedtia pulmonis]QKG83690.1 TIGR01777 family protein [Kroppenstedtia pulmonis]